MNTGILQSHDPNEWNLQPPPSSLLSASTTSPLGTGLTSISTSTNLPSTLLSNTSQLLPPPPSMMQQFPFDLSGMHPLDHPSTPLQPPPGMYSGSINSGQVISMDYIRLQQDHINLQQEYQKLQTHQNSLVQLLIQREQQLQSIQTLNSNSNSNTNNNDGNTANNHNHNNNNNNNNTNSNTPAKYQGMTKQHQQELASLRSIINDLKQQIDQLQKRIVLNQDHIDQLSTQQRSFDTSLETFQSNANNNNDINTWNVEKADLFRTFASTTGDLRSDSIKLASQIQSVQQIISNVQQSHQSLQKEYKEHAKSNHFEAAISQIQHQQDRIQSQMTSITETQNKHSKEYKAFSTQHNDINKQFKEFMTQNEKLLKLQEDTMKLVEDHTKKISFLTTENEQLKTNISRNKQQHQQLVDRLEQQQQSIKREKEKIQALTTTGQQTKTLFGEFMDKITTELKAITTTAATTSQAFDKSISQLTNVITHDQSLLITLIKKDHEQNKLALRQTLTHLTVHQLRELFVTNQIQITSNRFNSYLDYIWFADSTSKILTCLHNAQSPKIKMSHLSPIYWSGRFPALYSIETTPIEYLVFLLHIHYNVVYVDQGDVLFTLFSRLGVPYCNDSQSDQISYLYLSHTHTNTKTTYTQHSLNDLIEIVFSQAPLHQRLTHESNARQNQPNWDTKDGTLGETDNKLTAIVGKDDTYVFTDSSTKNKLIASRRCVTIEPLSDEDEDHHYNNDINDDGDYENDLNINEKDLEEHLSSLGTTVDEFLLIGNQDFAASALAATMSNTTKILPTNDPKTDKTSIHKAFKHTPLTDFGPETNKAIENDEKEPHNALENSSTVSCDPDVSPSDEDEIDDIDSFDSYSDSAALESALIPQEPGYILNTPAINCFSYVSAPWFQSLIKVYRFLCVLSRSYCTRQSPSLSSDFPTIMYTFIGHMTKKTLPQVDLYDIYYLTLFWAVRLYEDSCILQFSKQHPVCNSIFDCFDEYDPDIRDVFNFINTPYYLQLTHHAEQWDHYSTQFQNVLNKSTFISEKMSDSKRSFVKNGMLKVNTMHFSFRLQRRIGIKHQALSIAPGSQLVATSTPNLPTNFSPQCQMQLILQQQQQFQQQLQQSQTTSYPFQSQTHIIASNILAAAAAASHSSQNPQSSTPSSLSTSPDLTAEQLAPLVQQVADFFPQSMVQNGDVTSSTFSTAQAIQQILYQAYGLDPEINEDDEDDLTAAVHVANATINQLSNQAASFAHQQMIAAFSSLEHAESEQLDPVEPIHEQTIISSSSIAPAFTPNAVIVSTPIPNQTTSSNNNHSNSKKSSKSGKRR